MNRYMHTDLYPDFHVTFAKKAKINEIPAVSLSDLGLPYDVDFKEQKLEDLPKEIKDAIICEFMFLIDKLLPRDIQDLFYRIALDPRPAYWSAFEQAANLMQLERYDGHEQGNRKGQLVDHVRQGIQDLIEDGFTLQEIYDSTCVTKDMVTRTVYKGIPMDYASDNRARWDAMEVEVILFGVKDIHYKVRVALENNIADFCVFEGDRITLAIQYITDSVYLTPQNRNDDFIEAIDKLILYCHKHNIPLLLIDNEEIEDFEFPHRLTNVIKLAIGNKEYCDVHNEKRKMYIREEWDSERLCDFAAYQDAVRKFLAEPVLEYFQGQIKGMKLISNHLCYGPRPEPDDEIEQHLSLFADGRVFFSGYGYGDYGEVKYKRKRSKQFKVLQHEAVYVLSHIAMYFSREFPLDFATDVGDWKLELVNTEGKTFVYQGSLYKELMIDGVGLSYLLRKYLKMTDLFAFDGDARIPISRKADEYRFVNVSFGWGAKTYCYLCDDELIQEGDEVLVPVGKDGELKTVYVESVELHTAEDAPFPIDKCKKVVRRL